MKKGQTEMIGLLVIVVLLLVIGVVFLKFATSKDSGLESDLRTNIQATNLLRAVMRASIEGKTVSDEIGACYYDGAHCDPLKTEIEHMLQASLKKGEKYVFTVKVDGQELFVIGSCPSVGIVAAYQATLEGIFIDTQLKICEA